MPLGRGRNIACVNGHAHKRINIGTDVTVKGLKPLTGSCMPLTKASRKPRTSSTATSGEAEASVVRTRVLPPKYAENNALRASSSRLRAACSPLT